MLNWDEYGKDENSTPPVVSEPKTEVVNQTTEVKQPEPPQPAESAVSTEPSNIGEGSRAEAARKAVNSLDETAGNEELDEMMANAGRVQVDQKMMINCAEQITSKLANFSEREREREKVLCTHLDGLRRKLYVDPFEVFMMR